MSAPIIPVVQEADWRTRLQSLPRWQPPLIDTLIISPHPDDETLGVGGLIYSLRERGVNVTVAAITDGENAYDDGVDIRMTREREQTVALARMNVEVSSIHRFRIIDSGVAEHEAKLVELLTRLVSPGMHIIAPWQGDFHPDHEACGRAAATVARAGGAILSYYFFWTWHRGTMELLDGLPLVSFPLTEKDGRAKREALLCHRSQLHHASGEPILPENLLAPAYRLFEVYLPA